MFRNVLLRQVLPKQAIPKYTRFAGRTFSTEAKPSSEASVCWQSSHFLKYTVPLIIFFHFQQFYSDQGEEGED